MNPFLRNVLAILAGLIVGAIINMGIIYLGMAIIPPPEGVDPTTTEGLKEGMKLFGPKNFIAPFLAHAIGTLAGAYTAARIAANNNKTIALIIGAAFLIGGVMMVMDLPSPMWFNVLDLGLAYIPMAWLGYSMVKKSTAGPA